MGLLRRIDGSTTYGSRRTLLRTEDAIQDTGAVMRAVLTELQRLNAQVEWQNQTLAQILNERAHDMGRPR